MFPNFTHLGARLSSLLSFARLFASPLQTVILQRFILPLLRFEGLHGSAGSSQTPSQFFELEVLVVM